MQVSVWPLVSGFQSAHKNVLLRCMWQQIEEQGEETARPEARSAEGSPIVWIVSPSAGLEGASRATSESQQEFHQLRDPKRRARKWTPLSKKAQKNRLNLNGVESRTGRK
jgi:hypothetical protein